MHNALRNNLTNVQLKWYDCVDASLQFNNVNYSWWNDRNGEPKYFWSENNSRVHICKCGIKENCHESDKDVLCDGRLVYVDRIQQQKISARKLLPSTSREIVMV